MSIVNRLVWDKETIAKFAAMELPKLTPRQMAFVLAFEEINFSNPAKAMVNSGYKGKWARTAGNDLANHPQVSLYINIKKARSLTNVATSPENLSKILHEIADDPNTPATARTAAIKELRQLIQAPNTLQIGEAGFNGGVSINISVDKAPNTQEDISADNKEGDSSNSDPQTN